MPLLLLLLFFLSGLTSLIYQVVWLKYLNLTLGAGAYSVAVVLAGFMGGLGLGAWLIGKRASGIRHPIRVYGLLEGGIGLYALASPWLFHGVDAVYRASFQALGPDNPLIFIVKFLLSLMILLVPTLCMGGTLPLLVQYAERFGKTLGKNTGFLYALNTFGAFAGVAAAAFFFIPRYGYHHTLLTAVAGNMLIMLFAIIVPWKRGGESGTNPARRPGNWWLWIFFFMGFTSLGYEVFWTRILVFYTGSNVYAYSVMLASFLLGIAAGSTLLAAFLQKFKNISRLLVALEAGIAFLVIIQLAQFSFLQDFMEGLAGMIGGSPNNVFLIHMVGCLFVIFLPTFLMGATFPLCLRVYGKGASESGQDVGTIYLSNTYGSIAGSLAAGFLFLPLLGTVRSLLAYALLNGLLALVIAIREKTGRWGVVAIPVVIAAWFVAPVQGPFVSAGMYRQVKESLVDFTEDASGTAMVIERDEGDRFLSLEINGINVAGTSPDLYVIQKLQAHLPLLLHGNAKKILHIGVGSGGTAYSVSTHDVDRIQIAEISRAVIRQAAKHFGMVNHGVFDDPRVHFHVMDGRSFVLATPETFDCILSDSIHPKYAGNGFLYTEDYFRMVADRLNEGGVCSMWLPMYSLTQKNFREILKAFQSAFPDTTVWYIASTLNSYTIVAGKKGGDPPSFESFTAGFEDPEIGGDLAKAGYTSPYTFLACCVMGPKELHDYTKGIQPHRDDRPTVEYESNLTMIKNKAWFLNFRDVLEHSRFPEYPFDLEGADSKILEESIRVQRRAMQDHLKVLHRSFQ